MAETTTSKRRELFWGSGSTGGATGERAGSGLPPALEERRTRATFGPAAPDHVATVMDAGAYAAVGVDNAFSLAQFRAGLRVVVVQRDDDELVFDMVGIDAPLANAFRRVLIAEVPTMAIEHVYMQDNTSIIQDEVLSHRVGLVPIRADPRLFRTKTDDAEHTDENTLVFELDVRCSQRPDGSLEHERVLSSDLRYVPQGDQEEGIAPVHADILLAKLRPGQRVAFTAHAFKGVGKDHAKWSPVATASYRLLPDIRLLDDVVADRADRLVAACPMGVFDIEDIGSGGRTSSSSSQRRARVARPRYCTMCRECVRDPDLARSVRLMRVRDHFIFSIESTGILRPRDLFIEASKVLVAKCDALSEALKEAARR